MNTLVIVLIAMVVLALAYVFYGRRIANKWGIDPNAETPAIMTARTMFPQTDGLFSAINFHQSRAQALLPAQFRQPFLAGFRFCFGF